MALQRVCLIFLTTVFIIPRRAPAADNGVGDAPYLGWSSWTLQATKLPQYGKHWLSEQHIRQQADTLCEKLGKHGFNYINIDSGWAGGFDEFARPIANDRTFPSGIHALAKYLHSHGQKIGIYWIPGVSPSLLKTNPLIHGTQVHLADILFQPHRPATGWRSNCAIDFSKPGSQAYVDSIAELFASWEIDFLKLDGLTPGSGITDGSVDTRADVQSWSAALKKTHRPIWLTLSWNLDRSNADTWTQFGNAWRINDDVETYSQTLSGWNQIKWRFDSAGKWCDLPSPRKGWMDLDSLVVANGAIDGTSQDEKRSALTLWAIECSPLYIGGALPRLDAFGLSLLTNNEVIAVNQSGKPASPVQGTHQQAWQTLQPDGSTILALFNLDNAPRDISVDLPSLNIHGTVNVRDLWQAKTEPPATATITAPLQPHACRLLRLNKR